VSPPRSGMGEYLALTPGAGRSSSIAPKTQSDDTERQEGVRILVVEDDFLIAMQTEGALSEAGYHVVGSAATAEEAIALARSQQPALAVMDIRLASKRDGIDAAKELFEELAIRCIFATAHDDALTRKRAEPYAPLGWLAKPYSMASLVALVADSLSQLD